MRGEVVLSNFSQIKNVVFAALAAVGAAAAQAFGGWDMALRALLAFMAADYVTGLLVAAVFRRSPKTERGALSSRAGFIGLVKKCDILLLVLLAVMLDRATGSGFIRAGVCLFFTANEGLSILGNLGLMGVPYPRFLRDMLEALRKNGDDGEDER